MAQKQTVEQFGQRIKAQHPEYRDMDDATLGKAVLAKYPQYSDMVATTDADNAPPLPAAPVPAGLRGAPTGAGTLTGSHPVFDALSGISNFGAGTLNGIKNLPAGLLRMIPDMARQAAFGNPMLPTRNSINAAFQPPPSFNQAAQVAQDLKDKPAETLTYGAGNIAGPTALLGGLGEVAPNIAPIVKAGGVKLRTAAIGDPDVALARGLGITKSTRSGANAINTVGEADPDAPGLDEAQGARPFGKGAKNRADLEAKLSAARPEINAPLNQAHDLVANKRISGPDGPTTVGALEAERSELSPKLDALRRNPAEANRMLQNGQTALAAAKERYDALTRAMTPHLDETGIDSRAIRTQDAQVASTLGRIKGKTTLPETPQPYGFGKIASINLAEPKTWLGKPLEGARDIVAGRPLWSGRPTDVNIRDAFYNAGQKPTFSGPNPSYAKIQPGSEYGDPVGLIHPSMPFTAPDVMPTAEPRSLFMPDQGRVIPQTPFTAPDVMHNVVRKNPFLP
jgi:hypothetical protein